MSVPVTKGQYSDNETKIYSYLINTMKLNKAAACGVLANIQAESSFNPRALGDNGTSYGICQWHDTSKGVGRWTNLKNYCSRNKLDPNKLEGQLAYLNHELSTTYRSNVLSVLTSVTNTGDGAYESAYTWCYYFEVPANKETKSVARGNTAKGTYWKAYGSSDSETQKTKPDDKGNKIVEEAKKHIGAEYVWGASGPSVFDCSGFTYYVYNKAIDYGWERKSAYSQYADHGREVKNFSAGDLIYFKDTYTTGNTPNISHVAIATGNGTEFIHASGTKVATSSLDNSYWKQHYYTTKRLIGDSETVVAPTEDNTTAEVSDSATNAAYEDASDRIEQENAERLASGGNSYGYLVDLTNGGEFLFYAPEYSVTTTPNWDDVSVLGRSTTIKGYNSTSSRSVDIELELYAGLGIYSRPRDNTKDSITDLHDDIAFVQSLAYPDYSKAMVYPPAVVLLHLGRTFKMKGVVSNVQVQYKKPYSLDLRPMHAVLSFTVTHVTDTPPDYNDVRSNKFEGKKTGILVLENKGG